MTKEPKLKSAVRIVKEWQDLDNEVRRLQEFVATKEAATKEDERKPIGKSVLQYLAWGTELACRYLDLVKGTVKTTPQRHTHIQHMKMQSI